MQGKDMILSTAKMSDNIVERYLADLTDADLMLRPVDGMNHIAWQLGHLIASERWFMEALKPGSSPPLPEGFAEAHTKETIGVNDPKKFRTKDEYLSLWKKQRAASLSLLEKMSDADLDQPSPESMRNYCPKVGDAMNMLGAHPLMHLGQWVAVRRHLKKPVAI
jgi:hypothetical protein